MLLVLSTAFATNVAFRTHDPVFTLAHHLQGLTGVSLILETAPYAHRLTEIDRDLAGDPIFHHGKTWLAPEQVPWSVDFDGTSAQNVADALSAMQIRWQAHPSWDACTHYTIEAHAGRVEVTPARTFVQGRCDTFSATLDRRLQPDAAGNVELADLGLTIPAAKVGPTLRASVRRALDEDPEGSFQIVHRTRFGKDDDAVKFFTMGTGVSGEDPNIYSFHPDNRPLPQTNPLIEAAAADRAAARAWRAAMKEAKRTGQRPPMHPKLLAMPPEVREALLAEQAAQEAAAGAASEERSEQR